MAFDQSFEGFAVDELHGVEPIFASDPEVKNAGDIVMAEFGGGASFADEALAGDFAVEVGGVDDLEGDDDLEAGIEGFVGDAHGTAAEFMGVAVGLLENLVVVEDKGITHEAVWR